MRGWFQNLIDYLIKSVVKLGYKLPADITSSTLVAPSELTATKTFYPWYTVTCGSDLEQGDILLDCPVFEIPIDYEDEDKGVDVVVNYQNAIIMTQSCDLAVRDNGQSKVDSVLLCPIYFKEYFLESKDKTFGKNNGWENVRKGNSPGFHILNKCDIENHRLDFMLVDLRRAYSLKIELVRKVAESQGERIRLLPPYREQLSQAFARFFMRVGLPLDLPPFK